MASSIISSVAKELGARISDEVELIWNAKKALQNLKGELEAIQAVAGVADGLPYFMNEEVKDWLQKLKYVAYDAEDVIDEYQAKSTRDDHRRQMLVSGKQMCTYPFTLLVSCLRKHFVCRYQLGKKIKAINDRLTQISKERKRYKLEDIEAAAAAKRRAVGSNRATTSLMVEEDIVGRVSDRDDLVEKLLHEDLIMCGKSSSVPIISIVGIGGLGKTTLVRMVFNDERVKKHFGECMWWICVSQCLDAEDLARRMLQEVKGSTTGLSGLNTLCTILNNVLSRNKFLLVLDDVWDLEWWKQLEALLKKGAHGSRILITTRTETISEEISAAYMHKPEIFSFKESWQLFLHRALKECETERDLERCNLKDVGEDIVKKCGGLPIAVETVGSAMRLKRREREDWKYIAESGIWKMSSSNSSLLPGLVLSYDVLPPVLKRCFAYLRLCPKGHSLAKDDFIKNIMAHRIVEDEDAGADMEAIAKGHIDDLLGRCLFQEDKSKVFLSLHDIIHDLAVHIAGKEYNFNSVNEHTRHLVLGKDVDSLDKIELQATKVLRTLMCYGKLTKFPLNKYMTSLKRLRVLDLTGGSFSRMPDSIGDLILLRHLDLMYTKIEELPASIRKLQNLQTLLLDGSQIKILPKEVGHLLNLRHLGLSDTSNLQFVAQGLGNLTGLRTLNRFIICGTNGTDSGCNINELKELSKLRGKLVIEHLEKVQSIDDARDAKLQEKLHVEDLELVYEVTSEEEQRKTPEDQEDIFEVLQLPPDLKGLGLKGYCGRKFPAHRLLSDNQARLKSLKLQNCPFLTSVPVFLSLTCLHLSKCILLDTLPVLPQLSELEISGIKRLKVLPFMPELKTLSLENLEELNQVPCLPKLKALKMKKLNKWNGWPLDMEGRCLPSLSTLEISECPKLESIPHFPELRRLEIRKCNNLCFLPNDQGGLEACTYATLIKLKILTVDGCHGLKQLPCLVALEELEMRNLNNWEGWSTGSSMTQLQWLQMFGCPKLKSLPHFPEISYMSIEMCEELCTLWDEEKHPKKLETLLVFGCPRASFPVSSLPYLSELQNLGMGGFLEWPHRSAPLPIGALPGLRVLGMSGIPGQSPLPNWLWHLSHLEALHLSGITECMRLQGSWQNLKMLERLTIQNCPKLTTLEDLLPLPHVTSSSQQSQVMILSKLQELSICDCPQLKSLPEDLQQLIQLKSLTLKGLPEMISLPQQITDLHKLEELTLKDCPKISTLPPELSQRLKTGLVISGCTNLAAKKKGYRFRKPISYFHSFRAL